MNVGLVAENASLRAQLRQPEVVDLGRVDSKELLAELARRVS